MRNAYIKALYKLASTNVDVLALVSDNGAIVYDDFRDNFPDRFINFGIAEANMVSVAAGLASCGKIPFAYTISNFITFRAYEQVRNDVCMQRMNVKLVGIGVGFVYSDLGPTHHNVEDIALMRVLPGMTIFSPADPLEATEVTYAAASINGPVYIRIATGGTPKIYDAKYNFEVGKGVILRDGSDISILSTGTIVLEVIKAAEELSTMGISAMVINFHTLKPIDKEIILDSAKRTRVMLTVEEHSINGGLGSIVSEICMEYATQRIGFKRLGLNDIFPKEYGTYDEMKQINGLSKSDIVREALQLIETKR